MKTLLSLPVLTITILYTSLAAILATQLAVGQPAQVFPTPEAAVSALSHAARTTNRAVLQTIFGAAAGELVNPDEVQGVQELADFAAAFQGANRLVPESSTRLILEIGRGNWPFPIPLVKVADGWQFDTAAGLDELLNRRIGRNELDVLWVLRAYVQAQREYASQDRDGDDVLEFAQMLNSSPGQTDGLFWHPTVNGEISPLGPLVAYAHGEGYTRKSGAADGPQPFHGYLFRILTRQGKSAPGGKYDYVINGNMIGGFALVAWPAEYGQSGIMTFIVNQQGRVYQRDLGANTARIADRLRAYDPDKNWQLSPD